MTKINENLEETCNDTDKEENRSKESLINDRARDIIANYYSDDLIVSIEEFMQLKKVIDEYIREKTNNINIDEIDEYCNVEISIRNPSQDKFVELITTVSEYKSYFVNKHQQLQSFINTYDKYVELLKVYLLLMSGKKKTEATPETIIKLKGYYIKRQFYDDILGKLLGKKEVYEQKYTVLSRVLTFWEKDLLSNTSKTRFNTK